MKKILIAYLILMQISCTNLDKSEKKNSAILQSYNNKEIDKSTNQNSEELKPCGADEINREKEIEWPFYYVFFKFLFIFPYLVMDAYEFLTFQN
jgi:hypothetical protein